MSRKTQLHAGVLLAWLSINSCLASTVTAATWDITADGLGDAPSVQAGIDSAVSGDTVLVHPGTYNENINFLGKNIVVRSLSGPATTVIDGTGLSGRVVTFNSGESRSATLEGFKVTNGAGGIIVLNSEPSIIGNMIEDNGLSAEVDGGGIWFGAATPSPWFPLVLGNTIKGNRARNIAGGIGFFQLMVPEVLDNTIVDNEAVNGDGGGIYYRSFDDGAVIRGNTVVNNIAGDHGGGIYVWHINSPGLLEVEVSWNLVAGNYAGGSETTGSSGGGIWMWGTNAWVHHNTVARNTGDGPTNSYGGGVVAEQPGSPLIEKNIIALTTKGGGIWCGGGATPTIRNNLAWENLPANGVENCPNWWQSDGNIVDDPAFCDPDNGDYAVAQNSPAMTHPAGPLGALHLPGCGPVAVMPTTWGRIKSMYGSNQ